MGEEKRRHRRMPITAKVTRVGHGKKDFFFTRDLSLGGVFLQASEGIPVGTLVELELAIQGLKKLIKVKGKVVRIEKKKDKVLGIAIQFVDVDDAVIVSMENLFEADEDS